MQELSNGAKYDILSQGASKLPQLGDLDFPLYLMNAGFLEFLTYTSGSSDAP